MSNQPTTKPARSRLFYPLASIALLVLTFLGFHYFYLQMQAFPGRPLTPPIRTLVITHGVLMTAWMLLAVFQPLLVATGLKRVHMALGKFGALLAVGVVVVGYLTAVNAARVNPPDLKLFGLNQKEFLTVPLFAIAAFAVLVFLGVLNRKRSDIHRPMMFMASLAVVSAALGRMPQINGWYAGTMLEHVLSAFATTVALGGLLLVIKCGVEKRFDGWFATAYGILTAFCLASAMTAKTAAWAEITSVLMR